MNSPLNILIAHRSPLYRRGLELALDQQGINYQSRHCDHFRELSQRWRAATGHNLLLLDDSLPGLSCLCKLADLVEQHKAPVLLCSTVTDKALIAKLRHSGLRGLLPASMQVAHLAVALTQLREGERWIQPALAQPCAEPSPPSLHRLTATEMRVLHSLGDGLANKQIADSLNLSVHTVKTHMSNIFRKLGVSNRTRLVMSLQQIRLSA
uniref:response regulator transcription factor n=1 Tax=Marinobacterium profundum TaxID=1714300 RepID=UPI00082D0554|nr:response regulator transcription factor [Marinobacterium profundum]